MARELEDKESIISLKEQLLLEKERRLLEQQMNLKKLEEQNRLLREQLAASKKKDGTIGKGGARGGRKPRSLFPDTPADEVLDICFRFCNVVFVVLFANLCQVNLLRESY